MINIALQIEIIRKAQDLIDENLVLIEAAVIAANAPQPEPTPEPVPEPAPVEPAPIIKSFEFDTGIDATKWKIGETVNLPIKTSGYDGFQWVYVSGAEGNPWQGAIQKGEGASIPFKPAAAGDFAKAWPTMGPAEAPVPQLGEARDGPWMPTGVTLPPSVPPAPVGMSVAQRFMAPLVLGINNERFQPQRMALKIDYYEYQLGLGINVGRWFPGYRPDANMGWQGLSITPNQINGYLDSVAPSVAAGQRALIDYMDVMELNGYRNNRQAMIDYVKRFNVELAKRNWGPDILVPGAINECAQGTNAEWNPIRIELSSLIADAFPQHAVLHGGAGWKGVHGWNAGGWQVPSQTGRIIGDVHHYGAPGVYDWAKGKVEFAKAYPNMPFVIGELNDDFSHMNYARDKARWMQVFKFAVQNWPEAIAFPWAMIGNQNDFRLNRGAEDARFQPDIEQCFKECAAIVRKAKGL